MGLGVHLGCLKGVARWCTSSACGPVYLDPSMSNENMATRSDSTEWVINHFTSPPSWHHRPQLTRAVQIGACFCRQSPACGRNTGVSTAQAYPQQSCSGTKAMNVRRHSEICSTQLTIEPISNSAPAPREQQPKSKKCSSMMVHHHHRSDVPPLCQTVAWKGCSWPPASSASPGGISNYLRTSIATNKQHPVLFMSAAASAASSIQ